jgi:hypothetical protein
MKCEGTQRSRALQMTDETHIFRGNGEIQRGDKTSRGPEKLFSSHF